MTRGAAALGGAALAALGAAALNLPLQRDPLLLALPALLLFGLTIHDETAGILATLLLVPVVPVLGNVVRGPAVAPAELALLACGAALLLSRRAGPREPAERREPMVAALALAAAAGVAGGLAATLAAVPGWALPGAAASLVRNLWATRPADAATPLRAGAVHAVPLAAFLFVRRLPDRARSRALALIVAGMAAAGAWGIVEAAGGPRLWPQASYDAYARFGRVVTTLPDHNAAAVLFSVFLFPAVGYALAARGARRAAALLASALIGAGFLLTGSRTAWAFAALAALVVASRGLRSRAAARAAGATAAVFALLVLAALLLPGAPGTTARERLFSLAPRSAVHALHWGRLPFWRTGVAMAAAHPLAGVGPGRVPASFDAFRPADLPVRHENLHSWPIQCVAENGLPGGFLLLVPFGALAFLLVRSHRTARGPVAGLVPGLAAGAAAGLAAHPFLLVETQFLFWGAAALLPSGQSEAPGGERPPRRALRAGVALLLAWGIPRVALAPASEAGRWEWGTWGWKEGQGRYEWAGPEAGFWLERPPAAPVRLAVRYPGPPSASAGRDVSARADGGEWRSVSLGGGPWTDLALPPGAPSRGPLLVELRASRAGCPAASGSGDRRILAVQVRRP